MRETKPEKLEAGPVIERAYGLPSGFLKTKRDRRNGSSGPPFYTLGRRTIRYKRSEVAAWLESRASVRPAADEQESRAHG